MFLYVTLVWIELSLRLRLVMLIYPLNDSLNTVKPHVSPQKYWPPSVGPKHNDLINSPPHFVLVAL